MAAKGSNHGRSILDEEEVIKIFYDRRSLRVIAASYNVSHSTVQAIKSGRVWSHVTNYNKGEADAGVTEEK